MHLRGETILRIVTTHTLRQEEEEEVLNNTRVQLAVIVNSPGAVVGPGGCSHPRAGRGGLETALGGTTGSSHPHIACLPQSPVTLPTPSPSPSN